MIVLVVATGAPLVVVMVSLSRDFIGGKDRRGLGDA